MLVAGEKRRRKSCQKAAAYLYKFGDINSNELLIINLAAVLGWANFKYQFFLGQALPLLAMQTDQHFDRPKICTCNLKN
jgi:hypothetical protein